MFIKTSFISSILLFQIIFLTFLGYYVFLLLAINAGMFGFTRQITMPVRVLIVGSLVSLVFFNFNQLKFYNHIKIFLWFSIIFLSRIIFDYFYETQYYLSTIEVFFYFLSFSIIPFISLSFFRLNIRYLNLIFLALFISGFFFSILSLLFYREFIGQVERLSTSKVGVDVISPLSLSYCATLIIGVIISYYIFNPTKKIIKIIGVITILLSTAPFFLGASRGSLIALFVPFFFLLLARLNLKSFVQGSFLIGFFIFGLIYLSESLGSGLFQRFTNISSDIEKNSSSANRLVMWKNSFLQFQHNPFFGDQLGVEGFNRFYPHNIILEVLQSTGIVGFIPFFILIILGLRTSYKICKNFPNYSWICVIFIQSLVQNMFSGSLINSAWFWTSLALLYSTYEFLLSESKIHYKIYF